MLAGIVASMLPDADVLAFRFGIAYADTFGHRGASHSLAFALLLALMAAAIAPLLRTGRLPAALFVGGSALSHPLLDMFTNGTHGVALWWPLSSRRLEWPWHPVIASPLSLQRLASHRGLELMLSELRWIWLPACIAALALWLVRRALQPVPTDNAG
jgi:inner membrane protein